MDITGSFNSFMEWLKELWAKIDLKDWAQNIGGSSADAIRAAIYLGIGFAVGFLFKKYFRFFFFCIVSSVVLILFLQYNKILDVDWEALNLFLGFEPTADIGIMFNGICEWVKANLVITISSVIGFLVGYKLG